MPPNVLLIVLDAARARNLQLYDHSNQTTPYLSSFARDATVYTQARSPSTWSLPSHTSLFTGLEVPEHDIASRNDRLTPGHTIWETLGRRGYDTGVFSENPFITSDSYGLTSGFDTVVTGLATRRYPFPEATDPSTYIAKTGREDDYVGYLRHAVADGMPIRSIVNATARQLELTTDARLPESLATRPGNKSVKYAEAFLDWQTGRSTWAACLNLTDAHHPYTPTDPYDRWGGRTLRRIHNELDDPRWDFYSGREPWWKRRALTGLYDGCIAQVDAAIETIVETLSDREQLKNTLVVVTADHGEGFGEPSQVRPGFRIVGHAGGIHELLLHIPLIVRFPGQGEGERVSSAATLTQFPSVVKRVLNGRCERDGFVPDDLVVATSDLDRQFETSLKNYDAYRDEFDTSLFSGTARAVYKDRDGAGVRKFIQWGDDEAVVDIGDAQSMMTRVDLKGAAAEVTSAFDTLSSQAVRESAGDDVDNDTRRRLEDLGYM
jgi:arylsulfatase